MDFNIDFIAQFKDMASGAINNVTSSFKSMGESAKIAAGIIISDLAKNMAAVVTESVTLAGKTETLLNSYNALSTAQGGQVSSLKELREATGGTVADIDLLRSANQAMMLGLPTSGFAELSGAAIKLGHAMGIDAGYAVDSLTKGIGRQSKMILDNLGVVFDASEAYDWYADKLGVNSSALDENARKQAWMEYAIMQVTKRAQEVGDVTSETQLSQERWAATISNLQGELGNLLGPLGAILPAIEPMIPAFTLIAAQLLPGMISGLVSMVSQYGFVAVAQQFLGVATFSLAGIWSSAHGAMIAASNALKLSMLTNPITIAIMAIIAAVVILWQAWTNNWGGIQEVLAAVADWIVDKFQWLIDGITAVWNALNALWDGVSGFFGGIWDAINGAMEGSAEAVEQGTGRMIVSLEGLRDTVPIIGDVTGGITDLVLGMTGQTEAYYEAWATESIRIVEESMTAQLAVIDATLAKELESIKTAYEAQKAATVEMYAGLVDEATKFYLDQLQAPVLEGFAKVYEEYDKHYANLLSAVETGMQKQVDEVIKQRDIELKETQDKYGAMITETEMFYNEMLGIYEENLSGIRDARKEDLRDLELAHLLKKESLEKSLAAQQITEEEFQALMKKNDETYRDAREQISDDYRIQEIKAEKELETKTAEIESAKAIAIEDIMDDHAIEAAKITDAARIEEEKIREEAKATADRIETEKKDKIEEIKGKEKELTDRLSAEMTAIELKNKTDQMFAYHKAEEDKKEVTDWGYSEQEKITNEKTAKIEGTTNSFLGNIGKGFNDTVGNIKTAWDGMCSNIGSWWDTAVSGISSAATGLWDSISGGAQGLWDDLTGGSIWTDMLKEMEDQAHMYLGKTAQEFMDFNPKVKAEIEDLEAGNVEAGTVARNYVLKATAGAGSSRSLNINSPLVVIQGNADKRTAELAADMVLNRVKRITGAS